MLQLNKLSAISGVLAGEREKFSAPNHLIYEAGEKYVGKCSRLQEFEYLKKLE